MGIGGLALATTIASSAKTVLLVWFLRKKTGTLGSPSIIPEHLRILTSAALMTGAVLVLGRLLPFEFDQDLSTRVFRLAAWMIPGIVVYLLTLRALGSSMIRRLLQRIPVRR
jgi:peptidoglycan biosynthesis protein MviN/MurJ (putative lipid II flippase)